MTFKRKLLCADYKKGGLKIIDVKQMQTPFLLQWVTRLTSGITKDKSSLTFGKGNLIMK